MLTHFSQRKDQRRNISPCSPIRGLEKYMCNIELIKPFNDHASPYIGSHFFGHKSATARELFKPSTTGVSNTRPHVAREGVLCGPRWFLGIFK